MDMGIVIAAVTAIGSLIGLVFLALFAFILHQAEKIDGLKKEVGSLTAKAEESNKRTHTAETIIVRNLVRLIDAAHLLEDASYDHCTERDFPTFLKEMEELSWHSERGDPTPRLLKLFMDALRRPSNEHAHILLAVVRNDRAFREITAQVQRWKAAAKATRS